MIVGYARVSTQEQTLDAQLADLKKAGAKKIFSEKISGVRSDRPQFKKLMASLRKGDVVVVTKVDRWARSTRELLNTVHAIAELGASFKSLGDPLFDMTSSQSRLLVHVLAAVAEFEASLIRERTGAGRARAKAAGVRFGRPKKLSPYQIAEAVRRKQAGEAYSTLAASYGVSVSTVARL
jgi:DNA invertase Pin-like site-specific DNA recombinase